ncbi:MAG: hypothetical protein Kow0062_03150 [Acidobacteriota bacterium]
MAGHELVRAPGARAAREWLLGALEAELSAERALEPGAAPVRVIVPSRTLRGDLLADLCRRRSRPAVGLVVQTLTGAAFEILERAGSPPPRGAELFEVLVCRAARRHPALSEMLDRWEAARGQIAAAVRDLLDAGLADLPSPDPLLELVEETWPAGRRAERVRQVIACACDVAAGLAAIAGAAGVPVGRTSDALSHAGELLGSGTPELFPARRVFVYGFADATGRAVALLERLVQLAQGTVVVDVPRLPGTGCGSPEIASAYTARFESHFGALASRDAPAAAPARLTEIVAPGPEAEIRAIADAIRARLDAGCPPEAIGVVFRQPTLHDGAAIARHFGRLGIPFTAESLPAAATPAGRRAVALADLLSAGGRAPVDRLLDAQAREEFAPGLGDVRLALRAHGIVRVGALAQVHADTLPGPPDELVVPAPGGADTDDDARRVRHRRVSRRSVDRIADLARSLTALLAHDLPARGPAHAFVRPLVGFARSGLGWSPERPDSAGALAALEALERDLPDGIALERDEALRLAATALERSARATATCARAGVRVLDALAARGLVFRTLFVPRMVRDVFPRVIDDDPILPDAVRQRLEEVLPDIPVKARGWDEERHLFRSLAAAADEVVFSRALVDRDGRERAESPLLVELKARQVELEVVEARPFHGLGQDGALPEPSTAFEAALLAGLHGLAGGAARERLVAAALEEGWARCAGDAPQLDPALVASARVGAARELDVTHHENDLGPLFGFVGRVAPEGDLRDRDRPWPVTTIERYAACPWQALVGRVLRLGQPPDPLASVVGPTRRLVGSVVHRVVAGLAEGASGARTTRTLDEVLARTPRPLPPLDGDALERRLLEAARDVLIEEGLALPGLERLVARRARSLVETAWHRLQERGLAVRGAEVEGEVCVSPHADERVLFRADLALAAESGEDVLLDLKTGRVPDDLRGKRADTVARKLLAAAAAGTRLQAAVYARALAAAGRTGRGGYLYCDPDDPHAGDAAPELDAADAGVVDALEQAVPRLLAGIDAGLFAPRLIDVMRDDTSEPRLCKVCDVRQACRQGDSSATVRLRWWLDAPRRGARDPHPRLRAVLGRTDR